MIELKVAAKETVQLHFGGKHGWPEKSYIVDEEYLERSAKESEVIAALNVANENMAQELTRLRKELAVERQTRIPKGTPVYIGAPGTVCAVAGGLEYHLRDCDHFDKPADLWRPIETAPKDGTRVIVLVCNRSVTSALFTDNAWWSGELDKRVNAPTHWMPLPEPPR